MVPRRLDMDKLRNETLQIPDFKDPKDWIFENVILPKQDASRPRNLKLTPHQRAFVDAIMNPMNDEIDVLKGARTRYSLILSILLAYGLAYLAIKIMLAQPT